MGKIYGLQREAIYSANDGKVVLITNMENHMTDWKLYLTGKDVPRKKTNSRNICNNYTIMDTIL